MSEPHLPAAVASLAERIALPEAGLVRSLAAADLLDTFLRRQLLEGLCDAVLGASVAEPADPSEDLLAYGRRHGFTSLEQLDAWRSACGLNLDQLERLVAFEGRLQQCSESLWGAQVASLFLQHRADFDQVVLSVVRLNDPDLATELFFQLQEGTLGFAALVEHYARGQDLTNRGVIGPIRIQQLHPLLARVVRRYRPGALIPPLDINGCVHLIRIESLQAAQLDGPLQEQLLQRLRNQWLDAQLSDLHQRLLTSPDRAIPAAALPTPAQPAASVEVGAS